MEGARFLLAIVLSIAVVILVNLLFPPAPRPLGTAADTLGVETTLDSLPGAGALDSTRLPDAAAGGALGDSGAGTPVPAPGEGATADAASAAADAGEAPEADTLWVVTEHSRYGISTLGAALVSTELLDYASYTRDGPVQLVEPTGDALLSYGLRVDDRSVSLRDLPFEPVTPVTDTIVARDGPRELELRAPLGDAEVRIRYTFTPQAYLVGLEGSIQGLSGGTLLLSLGPRLAVNEADSAEDLRALGYAVNSRREGIESVAIPELEQTTIEEGPLAWVALKNKYFLAAALPGEEDEGVGFGGLIATAGETGAESIRATVPLDREGAFDLRLFFGPQDYGRLSAIGDGLEDVNPYGWRIFRPIIRPLAHVITWLLVEVHGVLGLGYGLVLILFGFAMRGLLWPLNAKAMRSQLKTMELQPRIKEIQAKYKDKPEALQKEMVRLYKEEGFNPLGGCLPMLIPWPVLITLFFVFQNTIEFRGVDFLWLPDLSRPDPLYILPVVLGLSLFALQFMSMRATPQHNPQMKMMMYVMPVMMVVIFLNFASGLNLYYAASNVASLPQQVQIIRERKKARERLDSKAET